MAGTAADYTANLTEGGQSDWFLPSLNELNELCKFARNQTTGVEKDYCVSGGVLRGGFPTKLHTYYSMNSYYSSSEYDFNTAWYLANSLLDSVQEKIYNKQYSGYVLPVRAFGAASALAVTTQPVGGTSGAALATQPVVRIVDASGNTMTGSAASVTVTASGGTLGGTKTVAAVNGVATFTNLTHTTAGTKTLTFASTALTSVTSASFTTAAAVAVALSCASGGTCSLGNTGPGGGKVFYVASEKFSSAGSDCNEECLYLEAAPISWSTAVQAAPNAQTSCSTAGGIAGSVSADPQCVWSGNTGPAVGATYKGGERAIGKGYANTSAIIGEAGGGGTAGKAATVARGYQGGSQTDWYLPSFGELTQMRTNNSYLGGYTRGMYWSSSQYFQNTAELQYLYSSGSAHTKKTEAIYVRPIRAFSPTNTCATGGTCVVGDIGPGGGNVFYVGAENFKSKGSDCDDECLYLEAAPSGWITNPSGQEKCPFYATQSTIVGGIATTADPRCAWSGNTRSLIGTTAQGVGIGSGYANTLAMVAQALGGSTTGKAATVSRAFRGGGKTDWYLPSKLELNQLCRYAWYLPVNPSAENCNERTAATIRPGFANDGYWSSSETGGDFASRRDFYSGSLDVHSKSGTYYVRPVRAFKHSKFNDEK
jgi:hypothetical protein